MGEARYGYSEDDDIIEQAMDELMAALEAKDGIKVHSAIEALIQFIQSKESNAIPSEDA
mgnify:CR=1 FL=1